jgi:hypothetical protein
MVKQIHKIKFSSLSLVFLLCLSLASFAQDKKAKKGDGKSIAPAASEEAVNNQVNDEKAEKKLSKLTYAYVVLVNPGDQAAFDLWKTINSQYAGLQVITSSSFAQANFVFTKNPEFALFKRAFGSYFQIFTPEDLEVFAQSQPCLKELDSEFKLLNSKQFGK